jgi:hypothetical protein
VSLQVLLQVVKQLGRRRGSAVDDDREHGPVAAVGVTPAATYGDKAPPVRPNGPRPPNRAIAELVTGADGPVSSALDGIPGTLASGLGGSGWTGFCKALPRLSLGATTPLSAPGPVPQRKAP